MTENEAREEICRVGLSLFARGYVHATAGNISVLLPPSQGGGFLITPTDACLGFLDPVKLARLDQEGQQLSGDKASKTIALHRRIYQATAVTAVPAHCVIHSHSSHCVALSLEQARLQTDAGEVELLPALTPYFVMKVGHVPLLPYARPGAPETADEVAKVIANYAERKLALRAVMLARLGPNVWHDSPAAAMAVLEELEETAKIWQLTKGQPAPLTEPQIEELRASFGASW